jgi:hypothetical protein
VRTVAGLLLLAALAGPAYGQAASPFSCGTFKAESTRAGTTTRWTITRGTDKSSEIAHLRSGPRFGCVAGEVLSVEFAPASGSGFVGLYFPDGSDIGYAGQIMHRNNRFVLPIQAKARIDPKYRAAFDYHCRLEMPGDPIAPASRADCIPLK